MKYKKFFRAIVLLALALITPSSTSALVIAPPPPDMFQWPWEQGLSWIAMDGFDNGWKRLASSPHNYKLGGAVDFAPHVNMRIGEDTSNFWVVAAAGGTVIQTSTCHIIIDHHNGWTTEYWHLDKIKVKPGDNVSRNQRMAVIHDNRYQRVCTGNEYPGPHLHFVVRPKMKDVTFAGWTINYNSWTNRTTFTKDGVTLGSNQPILNIPSLQVISRDAFNWDVELTGSVDAYLYERWEFQLTESNDLTFTASGTSAGLTPLIVLFDASGNEISRGSGSLTSTQPAGTYYIQIQPEAGSGFYKLLAHKQIHPSTADTGVSVTIEPPILEVGQSAVVTINLNNVPPEGLASVEFTCSYNPTLAEVSGIADAGLFGADAAMAVNGPQNGSFIVAIAGSNGKKATTGGPAFTFNVKGLQPGQTQIQCTARVSKGDQTLIDIKSEPTDLTINEIGITPTFTPTPVITPFPTFTPIPPASPTVTGQVFATKTVNVQLYDANNAQVASGNVDVDGIFTLTAPAGTYTIIASAEGFLKAQGTITLTDGNIVSMTVVSLIPGDLDANNVIDQFDAMTIGMSYNASAPTAADLNNDGVINVLDLELVAKNYGKSGAIAW